VQLAASDDFVNPTWAKYEPALKAAGVHYEVHQYPGTYHGFNNDTTPRYDAAQAKVAWDRTIAFFKQNLS
jgi:carboxymethylenebutenolidase